MLIDRVHSNESAPVVCLRFALIGMQMKGGGGLRKELQTVWLILC